MKIKLTGLFLLALVFCMAACARPRRIPALSSTSFLTTGGIKPVAHVTIPGGKFIMGADSAEKGFESAKPAHEVTVETFEMAKTEVTVEQYSECVAAGRCAAPEVPASAAGWCNWAMPYRQRHPMNCVTWHQAVQYAVFKGARLPSEAEWEYAASGGGRRRKYPWGDEPADCLRAVMSAEGGYGC